MLSGPLPLPAPHRAGSSLEGRPIAAYQFGRGPFRISLIAGCHADEPTGPRLLRKLVTFLGGLEAGHPLLEDYYWLIVPHANPDGEAVNRRWYGDDDEVYDLGPYLRYVDRAIPCDDIEYGFPLDGRYGPKRPENAFLHDLWLAAGGGFHLHASLHSMAFAFGAWFLIGRDWAGRSAAIRQRCRRMTRQMSYPFHDVDRKGEKGFHRIAGGFATCPDHRAMKRCFLEQEDAATASCFHPSSMEAVAALSPGCLTLVPERPFFIFPREKKDLSWPNPEYERRMKRLHEWQAQLQLGKIDDAGLNEAAAAAGIRAMPVADQMRLQWELVAAGVAVAQSSPSA